MEGEDICSCDNYRINSGDKKLATVEVAIAKQTLGVNVGLLPRKRIGIILRRNL